MLLAIIGVYMLIFHTDPFPANHEAIGLGKLHLVHAVIGVVFLGTAGYIWYSSRGKAAPAPAA